MKRLFLQIIMTFLMAMPAGSLAAKYDGHLLDAHAHIPRGVSVDFILAQYAKAGVEGAMLFVKLGDASSLKDRLPAGFQLFSDGYKKFRGGGGVTFKLREKRLQKFASLLADGTLRGAGEFYSAISYHPRMKSFQTDISSSDFRRYMRTVAKHKGIFHIHDERMGKGREVIFGQHPDVIFVLAHCGYLAPRTLRALFEQYPNLMADLSLITNAHFGISKRWGGPKITTHPRASWRQLLIDHADRFLVGSDIGADRERITKLAAVMDDYRVLLGGLPRTVADKIAHGNFERLMRAR